MLEKEIYTLINNETISPGTYKVKTNASNLPNSIYNIDCKPAI